jgi:RNA polymerase sigma-70 factor (ECF subfamily)
MNLAHGEAVPVLALTVWQETALEALGHVERFARASQPRAWVLAVAANVLKRKRSELARLASRELPFSELPGSSDDTRESAFFDQFASLAVPGPEQEVEAREQAREMLALVSAEDRQVQHLALLHDLDGQMLAQALNVPPSTARSRLHRALARLRAAWTRHEQHKKKNEHA